MLNAISKYINNNSWFDEDDHDEDSVSFSTRESGDVGEETYGKEDFAKAVELKAALVAKYGEAINVEIEAVDEWVLITVRMKGGCNE